MASSRSEVDIFQIDLIHYPWGCLLNFFPYTGINPVFRGKLTKIKLFYKINFLSEPAEFSHTMNKCKLKKRQIASFKVKTELILR